MGARIAVGRVAHTMVLMYAPRLTQRSKKARSGKQPSWGLALEPRPEKTPFRVFCYLPE
jgi:hypothetical protein